MKTHKFFVWLLVLFLREKAAGNNPATCADMKTCDECIGVAGCTWCKELKDPGSDFQRCNTLQEHSKNNRCSKGQIIEAHSSKKITTNNPISKTMRIQPQRAEVTLGVGKPVSIDLTYRDGEDKPLDLYYIMDLSYTMKDDKDKVSDQAEDLVKELQKITSNVRLGFGAFIDKPLLPFVSASQLRYDEKSPEDRPYGFRNKLSLTNNIAEFRRIVRQAKISTNVDAPEGTLDALMQAITCKNEIGWRNESSKLIVVATDGPFHIAGDGKIGGVVRPNDMKCHLENNEYTHSTKLDYPTIGEMNAVIVEHKVFVIFAVSKNPNDDTFSVYQELENHLSHSAAVQLDSDSSNVVEKVRTKYKEIRDTVTLSVEKAPKHLINIGVESKCSRNGIYFPEAECKNVEPNTEIRFRLNLELKTCPDTDDYDAQDDEIVISFFQLSAREKLKIKLEYDCECSSCKDEMIRDPIQLDRYCSGPGASRYISCGTCACQENRYGDSCQCSKTGENSQGNLTNCIDPKGSEQVECSGRGNCKCGQCECPREFNGKYCQDSTAKCRNPQGQFTSQLCSESGRCIKGECHCLDNYEGKYCECQKSKKVTCVEPGRPLTELCNGHGTCKCEESRRAYCECDSNYGGLYCGVCKVDCPPSTEKQGNRCSDKFLQSCVRCRVREYYETNPKHNLFKCAQLCDKGKKGEGTLMMSRNGGTKADVNSYEFIELTGSESLEEKAGEGTQCQVRINSTCNINFRYEYRQVGGLGESDALQIFYKPTDIYCDAEPPLLWYIFGIIAGVLFAGILGLLVWKLATYLHDRREYQRFEKETAQAKWQAGENPLYNKPMSDFENPAYKN